MHRHFTLSKGECRIELVSEPDGHTFRWAELYRFGELVDETDDEMQVRAWMIGAV